MGATAVISEKVARAARIVQRLTRELYRGGPSRIVRKLVHRQQYWSAQRRVDAEYGTETLAMVAIQDLSASGPNVAYAYEYHASSAYDFDTILKRLPIEFSGYTFVDLGCGKGLTLILALRFGFQRIVGIEFGSTLCEIAQRNLERLRQKRTLAQPIDAVLGDAAEFQFPAQPLVVYLYNPFGPVVIARVLANLKASLSEHPRGCWIVYVRPLHHSLFAESGYLQTFESSDSEDLAEPYAVYTNGIGAGEPA
jgi:SAM-dependent methyltransferase